MEKLRRNIADFVNTKCFLSICVTHFIGCLLIYKFKIHLSAFAGENVLFIIKTPHNILLWGVLVRPGGFEPLAFGVGEL